MVSSEKKVSKNNSNSERLKIEFFTLHTNIEQKTFNLLIKELFIIKNILFISMVLVILNLIVFKIHFKISTLISLFYNINKKINYINHF